MYINYLPFKIPNVHSTSFLIDSAHRDHLCIFIETEFLKGHISVDQFKYPPSTRIHAPV